VHAANEIGAKYLGSEIPSIKKFTSVLIYATEGFSSWGTPHGHYVCKNPSQTITCVAGAHEALSIQHTAGLRCHRRVMEYTKLKLNSVASVRTRTIPTERPPPVGEVSANFCG